MKNGLVLEGGGMRGLFTAGVLDVLMEKKILVDSVIGVSAGALFGCNYKSCQVGRGLRYNIKYKDDKRYMSVRSLLKTGNYLNTEFAFDELPKKLDVFDFKTFEENPVEFHVVCTDIVEGKPVYKRLDKADEDCFTWLRASGSMPLMAKPVNIEGHTLLDGGISDSIPLAYSQKMGNDKNIVVLTQPRGYRKKAFKNVWLFRLFMRKYPSIVDMMRNRHDMYNEEVRYVAEEEEKGHVLVIAPDSSLNIGRLETNEEKMRRCYEHGREKCLENIERIVEYLK